MITLARWSRLVLSLLLAALMVTPALAADPKATRGPAKADETRSASVDLNSATAAELEALPGIGKATAKKIIDNRPYARKDELVDRKIVSRGTYEKIQDRVVARRTTAAEGKRGTESARGGDRSEARSKDTGATSASPRATTAERESSRAKVWVNTATGVYHREGDRWYGKTKQGQYMSEDEAVRAGYRLSKQTPTR
jgi:hypothetical protein